MHRRFATVLAAALLTSAIILPPAPVLAQDGGQSGGDDARVSPDTWTFDLAFDGGSLADYVEAIRKAAAPAVVNVILPENTPHPVSFKVQPLSLRNVTVLSAVKTIEFLPEHDAEIRFDVGQISPGGNSDPIYRIFVEMWPKHRVTQGTPPGAVTPAGFTGPPETRVFMIRDLIDPPQTPGAGGASLPTESILGAVDAVLADAPSADPYSTEPPKVRFHPESATLILTAPRPQLSAVDQLLSRVREDLQMRREKSLSARARLVSAQRRAQRTEIELQAMHDVVRQAEAQMQLANERLDRIRAMRDTGAVSEDELAEAELMVATAEAERSAAMAQMQMKQTELEEAHKEIEETRRASLAETPDAPTMTETYRDDNLDGSEPQFIAVVEAVEAATGGPPPSVEGGREPFSFTIVATEAQHAIIRAAFDAMRQAASHQQDSRR